MITALLGTTFVIGLVLSGALHLALDHPSLRVRRAVLALVPGTTALGVTGLTGLVARVVPGVGADTGLVIGVLVGYLHHRVLDQHLHGRPRVFGPDQVVLVPADWH